jgi:hypothetical protein
VTPEEHRAAILEAEAKAAAGIERDLVGLHAVHGDVVAFIESRWLRWLDRRVESIERAYYLSQGFDPDEDDR